MQVGRPTNVQVGGKQTDRQTDKTNRYAGRQTNKCAGRRKTDRQTDGQDQ